MLLKRIDKLKKVGIFRDFEWPNPNNFQDFKRYNVIYGWNGTGKSTLSRLFQCLEKEKILSDEFVDSEFELIFDNEEDDEIKVTKDNIESTPAIRVFNKRFVETHIKWEETQANSIAYVGEENIERKKQLDNLEEKKKDLLERKNQLESKKGNVSKEIKKWKTQHAKIIKDALTTEGRSDKYANYDRAKIRKELRRTFKERVKDYSHLIKSEEELAKIKTAIHQSQKEKVESAELNFSSLEVLYQPLKSILNETVVSKAIDELKKKPNIERWVRNGFQLHKEEELEICQFCKQKIPEERIAKLEGHFSDAYEDYLKKLNQLKSRIQNAQFELTYPNKYEINETLRDEYELLIKEYKIKKKVFEDIKKQLKGEIERKLKALHKSLETKVSIDKQFEKSVRDIVSDINQLIKDHNSIVENFEDENLNKKREWELSHIASNINGLIKLENEEQDHLKEIEILNKNEIGINQKIERLKKALSDNQKAANAFNTYLKQYFGRDDIQVEFDEKRKGFYFKRGEDEATNLSEGEKTGIALIYFLTKLGERDFDIQECIVVIDDPVSSLDLSSLFYAFSFIKENCKEAKQLLLFTHNFELLRQLNNWLRYVNEESRFMIKCEKDQDGRKSYLDKIDPLLTDFESEYHYLFKLLYKQKLSDNNTYSEVYNYPNIARRYLEMFFSFRAPNESSMHSKINKAVKKDAITKEEGTALRHFLNVYSHGDNEASFVRFDVTHLEKANAAIKTTLKLVENYDLEHYQGSSPKSCVKI